MRRQRQDDGGRVLDGRGLERLRADQHADIEQDRRDRDDRHQRQQQRDDAEPGQDDDHQAGRGGIADAAAHRLPAGMADIDRVDERVAHQAADQADDAVGGEHPRGRIMIARGFRAFDIVHRLDQVVDAERDGGDQDDAEEFEAGEDMVDRRQRHGEAEIGEAVGQLAEAHAADIRGRTAPSPRRSPCPPRWRPGPPECRADSARRRTSSPG